MENPVTNQRNVEIAKWLLASDIDYRRASTITGLPEKSLRSLHMTLSKNARRAFMPSELDIAVSALGALRDLTFVQVGANDGKSGDPIFKLVMAYGEFALLIEPQPWLIDAIEANYSGFKGKLFVESIAIGTEPGVLSIYFLKEKYWAEYADKVGRPASQIASPIRDQLLKRIAPRLKLSLEQAESYIDVLNVEVKPLSALLAEYGIDSVDVLQIDCEGWDFNVISSLGEYRPAIIHFESFNLTPDAWQSFVTWSKDLNYGFIQAANNTLAIRGFSKRFEL